LDAESLSLQTGKDLQLVIAAARDLPRVALPLRARRARRRAKLAVGIGSAASAAVGGALFAANLGFWAGVGAALGLVGIPLVVTLAGGGLALGFPARRSRSAELASRQREQVELAFACFLTMAEADGRISEEERILLRAVLLEYPLTEEERGQISSTEPLEVLVRGAALPEEVRRKVLLGTWMLAEADGVSPEEEEVFEAMAASLGLGGTAPELRRRSRDVSEGLNDLVASMFRTCQAVLAPSLAEARANEFLESLARIAASPPVRRSLRNSIASGFSSGGVTRLLDEHGEAPKLVAQAQNAIRSVYAGRAGEGQEARGRLLDLARNSRLGPGEARRIASDIDLLFDEALAAAAREAPPEPGRGQGAKP
jgi:tellurite resistance protein